MTCKIAICCFLGLLVALIGLVSAAARSYVCGENVSRWIVKVKVVDSW
jgi:hypothetical protein